MAKKVSKREDGRDHVGVLDNGAVIVKHKVVLHRVDVCDEGESGYGDKHHS